MKEGGKKQTFIRRKKDFILLRRRGKKVRAGGFFVLYRENNLSYNRFALFFPRRTGKAVQRTRFKRWARYFVRGRPWPAGLDIMLGFEEKEKDFYKDMNYKRFFSLFEKICQRIEY